MRPIVTLALALTLAACASGDNPQPPPTATAATQGSADQCGARAVAYLVGKQKSEIPVPVGPARRRVVCSTCVVTMDFIPERLNIVFDADTGVITQVKCG